MSDTTLAATTKEGSRRSAGAGLGALLLVLVLVASVAPAAAAAPLDREDALQTFNRDVYFLDGVTLRNPTADTPADAQLYSAVGAALPRTWGEWQAASAESKVATRRGGGEPGMTYHPFPNRGEFFTQGEQCRSTYGEDAMRQVLILQQGFGG